MNSKHIIPLLLLLLSTQLTAQFAILVGIYPNPYPTEYFAKLGEPVKELKHQNGYFHYQLGSFKNYDLAELRLARVRAIGFDKASILDLEEAAILEATPCPYEMEQLPGALNTWFLPFQGKGLNLDAESKQHLRTISAHMHSNNYLKVTITGHTDNEGPAPENALVGEERARVVRNFLIDQCKIPDVRINTSTAGESKPMVPNSNEFSCPISQYQRMNNRATVTLHL